MVKKFIQKSLMVNWIFYLMLGAMWPASASTDIVAMYSGGGELITHEAQKARLLPLCTVPKPEWHAKLTAMGYLPSHSVTTKISVAFYTNYGSLRGKDTQHEAAVCSWRACDEGFDSGIVDNVKSYIERAGATTLTPAQIDHIKGDLNPSRGAVRPKGTTNRYHFATLDAKRLCKFSITATSDYDTSSEWTCNRYTARMTADLDMGIYEFLGR